jgi:hypothetical protein
MLEGCWRELEDAMQASGLLCEAPMPEVSHGMCEECEAVVLALLDREDACNDAHANGSQPAAVRGGPV